MHTPYLPTAMRKPPDLQRPRSRLPPALARRHALLINPFYPKDPAGSFGKHLLTPSLALTTVAAATPLGWSVRIHDENLLTGLPPSDPAPEVVGITVHLTFVDRAIELARHYRSLGSKVVMGGLHAASSPEELRPHCDALVAGDGVSAWPELLRDVECGALRSMYLSPWSQAPEAKSPPRRDLLPKRSFLTRASIIATRGCRNRCDFCYQSTRGLRQPSRERPVDEVAAEIESLQSPYVVFLDNNLGARRAYLRSLCRALRPLGIIWSAAVTLDVTDDPDLVREMALSGCTGVFLGLETLSDRNLADSGKRSQRTGEYARRVGLLKDHGIQVTGSFVFGFDEDGPDVFARTLDWIEANRLECATFHILTPYPGTPLYARLESEGRILTRDWSRYDTSRAVFRPKRMTVEQLERGYHLCYRRLFTAASIWKRRPEGLAAAASYLAMAILYKKSNRLWHGLIKAGVTGPVWAPLVRFARWRHVRYRRRCSDGARPVGMPVPAGV